MALCSKAANYSNHIVLRPQPFLNNHISLNAGGLRSQRSSEARPFMNDHSCFR
ncbi:hypothetical protein RchiOBHm_Chr6g0296461 [Rosa chinensis]|uniref:Uncharacterized protein n=1 Tax=Rosa chinensis TaxID=74649 RepID=A0A2P6PXE8_ROSCH|nr:hypothetical protein RchiOBHm_Chr6g0296461 [Rosa chinensis]